MRKSVRKTVTDNRLAVVPAPEVKKTPDVLADEALAYLVNSVTWDVESAQRKMAEFKASFEKDPDHAFEWSGSSAFEQAAKLRVCQELLAWVKMGQDSTDEYTKPSSMAILKEVRRLVFDEVVRRARWPEYSTSFSSNEMSKARLAQTTEMMIKIDSYLKDLSE